MVDIPKKYIFDEQQHQNLILAENIIFP
jgi:hypothetical protein